MALHGVWLGNVRDCFFVFFVGLISDKVPFSKVKATSRQLSCKDSFTFWQSEKELYVSIYMCVCVEFHFPWTLYLNVTLIFYFFLGGGGSKSILNVWNLTYSISCCVWCMVCRPRVQTVHKNLHRIKCCFLNPNRRSIYDCRQYEGGITFTSGVILHVCIDFT